MNEKLNNPHNASELMSSSPYKNVKFNTPSVYKIYQFHVYITGMQLSSEHTFQFSA